MNHYAGEGRLTLTELKETEKIEKRKERKLRKIWEYENGKQTKLKQDKKMRFFILSKKKEKTLTHTSFYHPNWDKQRVKLPF